MDFKIREATIDDIDSLVELESNFVDPWPRDFLIEELTTNPINKILVIEDGDLHNICGFINYMVTFNSATISQIAVDKKYRRLGLATKLLNEMENNFPTEIDDKVETVTLEVRESNVCAQNLYSKNGYEKVLIKNKYYKDGENAVYMIKRIF